MEEIGGDAVARVVANTESFRQLFIAIAKVAGSDPSMEYSDPKVGCFVAALNGAGGE